MQINSSIESLAREVCQNSLEAHSRECKEPLLVSFSCKFVSVNKIPDIDTYLNKKNDEILILKASDYNTAGLLHKNWDP